MHHFGKTALSLFLLVYSAELFAIVNGEPIKSDFPVVRLTFKNNSHVCTGVFIDPYTILTAAHCLSDKKTWPGFSLELESIRNKEDQLLDIRQIKNLPHPKFSYHWTGNKFDIGIIKTSEFQYHSNFPKIIASQDEIGNNGILYGCGRTGIETKELRCLQGENKIHTIFGYVVTIGVSSHSKKRGERVSVAPNDSGGPILDSSSGKIIGIHWGTWLSPRTARWGIWIPSFMTFLGNDDSYKFVRSHLGKTGTE